MNLAPYRDVAMRWKKVCKHVFATAERWWEVFGSLPEWHRDWNTMRVAGCLHGEAGHLAIGRHQAALDGADRNHSGWLAAAERACDEAIEARRVFPTDDRNRVVYVGDAGVMVYVAGTAALVTCFRPARGASEAEARALARVPAGWAPRAAVRRVARRASLAAGQRRRRTLEAVDEP